MKVKTVHRCTECGTETPRWLGRCPETEPFLGGKVRGLLRLSLWGYLASLAMLTLELALA